jgi:hypothetical protein
MSIYPKLVAAVVDTMPLERIQKLLRSVSGNPFRCRDDAIYRSELWRRLDRLTRKKKVNEDFDNSMHPR